METRRLMLAAFLSLALVVIWGRLFQPAVVAPPDEERGVPASEAPPLADSPAVLADDRNDAETPSGELTEGSLESATLPDEVAPGQSTVVIDTELYRAELSNRGAQMLSFQLKRERTADGEPVEMVRPRGSGDPYPFALLDSRDRPHPLNQALFVVERRRDEAWEEVRFRHRSSAGAAEKVLRFQPSGLIDVETTVTDPDGWGVLIGPGVRDPDDLDSRFLQRLAAYSRGEEEETLLPAKQNADVLVPTAGLRWATLEDNYFLTAVVPEAGLREVVIRPVRQRLLDADENRRFLSLEELAGEGEEELDQAQELLLRSAGEPMRFVAFYGAKRYSDLSALPYGLDETVRWGFSGILARPLYFGLEWIYERIPNYGWAIILMTLVIKMIFFPLTHKSQKSMAKMQELSPKIQALRNRYRGKLKDRQGRPNPDAQRQMNEEMMALYRKAGANPASGCLPILIQIPVFFAFFRLLSTAIELRNAPWIGWVDDLSMPDGWYLLPAAMLGTSVLLQRMTPPPPDPMQRRMMQMMPIVFGLLAVTFPSGLVLYWTTNNVLTMAQQAFYLRSKKKKAAPRPPAKPEDSKEENEPDESDSAADPGPAPKKKKKTKQAAKAKARAGSRRRR